MILSGVSYQLDKLKKQYPQAFEGEYKIVEDES